MLLEMYEQTPPLDVKQPKNPSFENLPSFT